MLTRRNFQVAKIVAESDLGYKEIADRLNVVPQTIKGGHMPRVFAYFGVHSRLALALEWNKHKFHLRDWESYLAWHRRHYARGTDNR